MRSGKKALGLSSFKILQRSWGKLWPPFKLKGLTGLLICSLLFFNFSGVAAEEEKEKQEQKTVFEEIVVTTAPESNPATPINTRYGTQYNLVTEEQIKEQNALDFQSTLRNVPGVMFQSKNLMGSQTSHSIYIRGRGSSHPSSDFTIDFDGAPRFGALFGQTLSDGIAVPTIGGIEIFKSPQPSQFGSGYALLSVLPKYLTQDGQEFILDVGGGSYETFNESLSGGLKKGPFDFYVSQNWTSTDGHVDHSRAQQQNYYANIGYEFNKVWSLRLLANYVSSQTVAPRPDITPTPTNGVSWPGAERYDTETTFTTLTLSHQYDYFSGYLKAYRNDTDFDLLQELTGGNRAGSGTGGLWSRQEIELYGLRAKEKARPWSGAEIMFGADLDWTELKNTQRTYTGIAAPGINGGQAVRVWDFPDTTIFSPYLAMNQMIGHADAFHVIPSAGFRYFSHNEFKDKSAAQAGLVAGYRHTDLHFNYARGVNYPSPIAVMNLVVSTSTVTNPDQYWKSLKPEVVDHYEVGLTHSWPEIASLAATAFYDKGKDRFRAYMGGSIPTQYNDPTGKYEIRGLELSATATPVKSLDFFAGVTWLDSEATGNDGIKRDHLPYTPSFQFQAGATWKLLDNFRLYMDMQHLHNLYQGTSMRGTFNYGPLDAKDKLGDITLFNARLSYTLNYKPLRVNDSEIYVAVNNIFDQDYEYAKGYGMPGTTVFAGISMKFK